MILLLNSTKTMNLNASVPPGLNLTQPRQMELAHMLAVKIAGMSRSRLADLMSLSENLAKETRNNAKLWGLADRPKVPALFAFTGMLYKSLDPESLDAADQKNAQKRVRILSGLYGVLRPFDQIEAYRLEMGHKLVMGKTKNLVAFWKKSLTAALNNDLKNGEAIVNLAAQEYMKAVDLKNLNGPVISPVFKERQKNGSLKTVAVHAKKARGELVRYALMRNARTPGDLVGFHSLGWAAAEKEPKEGPWLFTRPVSS